jgi:hypothetical protein
MKQQMFTHVLMAIVMAGCVKNTQPMTYFVQFVVTRPSMSLESYQKYNLTHLYGSDPL